MIAKKRFEDHLAQTRGIWNCEGSGQIPKAPHGLREAVCQGMEAGSLVSAKRDFF